MVVKNSKDNYYKFFTFDTVDGTDKQYLDVSSHTTTLVLNAAGEIDITLSSPPKGSAAWRKQQAITLPKKRSLGIDFRGTILEAGPIQKRKPDPQGRNTKIVAKGIWALLQEKIIFSNGGVFPAGSRPADDVVEFKNTTPQNIMASLVRTYITCGIPGSSLPISVPSPAVTGTTSRKYEGFKMVKIGSELDKLSNTDSGCDVQFRPVAGAANDTVSWAMELGNPLLSNTNGKRPVFDLTVPSSPVISFTADEDGSGIVSRTFVPGNGSGKDMAMGWASTTKLTDQKYPFTESSNASKRESDTSVLQDEAALNLKEATANWRQWTLTVRPDATPVAGTYRPGDFADLYVGDDYPDVAAGYYVVRIMQIVFSDSDVTITMSPLEGTGAIDPNSVPRHFAAGYSYHAATLEERLNNLETYGANQISLTGADGSGLVWTPDTGLTSVDSTGASAPFDPSGASSSGGVIDLGVVSSYTSSSKIAMVTVDDGSSQACANWWDEDQALWAGDKVVVSQRKKDSQFGVTQRYGKGPAGRGNLPYGKMWIDSADSMGFGAGKAIGYATDNTSAAIRWKVYDLTANSTTDLSGPYGYEQKLRGIYIDGINVYGVVDGRTVTYQNNPSGTPVTVPNFYKWDKAAKSWSLINTGTAMSALSDDEWASVTPTANYFSGSASPFAPLAFATAKWTSAVSSGSMYRWNAQVTVWRMTTAGTFDSHSYEFSTYQDVSTNTTPPNVPFVHLAVGGDHAYIRLHKSLNYMNLSSGAGSFLKAASGSRGPLEEWFNADGLPEVDQCKVSTDGIMYTLSQQSGSTAMIVYRSNTANYATQLQVGSATLQQDSIVGGYVHRDGLSSEYYVSGNVYTLNNGVATGMRGAFLRVVGSNTTTLVQPVAGNYDRMGNASVYDVTQLPDGSFVTTLEAASNEVKSGVLVRSGTYSFYQYKGGALVTWKHP